MFNFLCLLIFLHILIFFFWGGGGGGVIPSTGGHFPLTLMLSLFAMTMLLTSIIS